jgi:hypothetical protein
MGQVTVLFFYFFPPLYKKYEGGKKTFSSKVEHKKQ